MRKLRMIACLSLCLLSLLLAAVGCSAAGEPLVKPGDRVAVFGDSISTGKGYGYLAVELVNRERPDLKLVWLENGHPGWRADHAMNAVPQVLEGKPTLVTIMFGTNDLGQQGARGVAELRERLRRLVTAFNKAGVRVVLLTTPYTANDLLWGRSLNSGPLPRMAEEVFALGKEEGVPVFDMFAAMRLAEGEALKADPRFFMFSAPGDCHPNARGHEIMARALADFLLGRKIPPRIPFVWKHPTEPVGVAVRTDNPLDVTAPDVKFPGGKPMVLDKETQISLEKRWKGPHDLSARAMAAWDDANLYVEVKVTDDVVIPGKKQPAWDFDGIEFFIDVRPPERRDIAMGPGYFQMLVPVVDKGGRAPVFCGSMDTFDAATVKAGYKRTQEGYVLRFAMPWPSLKFKPVKGQDIGFDFAVNDRDDEKVTRYKALWRGCGDDYTNAGSLGTLRLD